MKKLIILAAAAIMMCGALSAQASDATAMKGGLGFHVAPSPFTGLIQLINPVAPQFGATSPFIGMRQWFNPSAGIDLGVGFTSVKAEQGTQKETWTGTGFDIGVPLVIKKFDKVSFIFRPGFQYGTIEDKNESPPTSKVKYTLTGVTGTFEAEWMVAENVSISAAHGVSYSSLKSDDTPQLKVTSFGSTGTNFTQLGFMVYLW